MLRLDSGTEASIVSKEDRILSKLYWAKDSRSEVQLCDIRNLLSTCYVDAYLCEWIAELGLAALAEPLLP